MSNAEAQIVYYEGIMRKIREITEGENVNDKTLIYHPTNTHYGIYPAMKKFPATSAIMMKCLFKRFIVSTCFKEYKDRELFTHWAKGNNPNCRQLFPITYDGFQEYMRRVIGLQSRAEEGIFATWECLPQARKLSAWLEISSALVNTECNKRMVADLATSSGRLFFDFAYQNVHKRCHNGDCQNTCRNQCPCRETRYCSAACQNADWKRHKQYCQFIRK